MTEFVTALNTMTWPGALVFIAVCATIVAIVWLLVRF